MELVQKYTNLFHWAMKQFNCNEPSIEPTATGHIVEQIGMIEDIIQKGFAYVVNGSVYFDVKKYAASNDYGKLSGRVLEDLLDSSQRESLTRELDGQSEKHDPADFALWKAAPPEHIMRWKSPWGEGFPGWHIECSAMAGKYLGSRFDIHGGGMDLLFPHHESEIAQSTVCHGHNPVNYWMHNNMITINGRKMGKSYHNVIKLTELFSGDHPLLNQPFHPMTVRFFILQSHYRSTLDFSSDALAASEKAFKRIWEAHENLQALQLPQNDQASNPELDQQVQTWIEEMPAFMDDYFSTPKVIANLFELAPIINSLKDGILPATSIRTDTLNALKQAFTTYLETVFGLQSINDANHQLLDPVMRLLLELRQEAKSRKDFATSDKIRENLTQLGIAIKDEKDGKTSWNVR
jgi:cysteinyl-tRNA synthetase